MSPITTTTTTESIKLKTPQKEEFIFVLQLHDGRFVIGQATNACKRIAAINSGYHPFLKKALQVNRIVGIKGVTEERKLQNVVSRFCDKYGEDKVLVA